MSDKTAFSSGNKLVQKRTTVKYCKKEGKPSYLTWDIANEIRTRQLVQRQVEPAPQGVRIEIYFCEYCQGYHHGHQSRVLRDGKHREQNHLFEILGIKPKKRKKDKRNGK